MDFFGEKNNATTYTNEVRMIMGCYCSVYFIVCIMMSISTHTYIPLLLDIIAIILTPVPALDLLPLVQYLITQSLLVNSGLLCLY